MEDIAKYLNKSVDTIKAHERSVFQKVNVNNVAEALVYAQNHHLL